MQAVEPAPRGRARLDREQLRQHGGAVGHDLAAREVRRAVRGQPATGADREGAGVRERAPRPVARRSLADDERRVQALCSGAVPAGVSDRGAHPQRVRERLHPAGHLQRVRVLRRRLPVRGDHPEQLLRPCPQVHALLRPPEGRAGPSLCKGVPDRLDPVRTHRGAARAGPQPGGGAASAGCSRSTRVRERPDGDVF